MIDIFLEIEIEFHRCLRAASKQCQASGVALGDLFAAAVGDRECLLRLIRQARHHDYARLLGDIAEAERGADLARVIRCWVDAAWESARSHIQVDRHEASRRDDFADRVRRMLGRISRLLIANPSRIPRCLKKARPPEIDQFLSIELPVLGASPR